MKHKPSTTAKWSNGFKKIHNLKVEHIDDNILFSKLSDIYSHFEILFDIYNNEWNYFRMREIEDMYIKNEEILLKG